MSFKVEIWSLSDLVKKFDDKKLNLNPPYQRNSIWSIQAQRLLIDTINKKLPIPAFFVQEKKSGIFDLVDGQQRTRAVLKYSKQQELDETKPILTETILSNYKIAVNILSEAIPVNEVREFYVRVNRSGKRLERPELNKAEYFNTNFLQLVTELSNSDKFQKLQLFKDAQTKRMFDRDFVEELVAQVSHGITDKKKTVDTIYKEDITVEQVDELKNKFLETLKIISEFDSIKKLSDTRYSQKNDFYTLFGLILKLKTKMSEGDLKIVYKILVAIAKGIRPSNDECEILQDYAFNCVTQSNSKKAREKRLKILLSIIENENKKPNKAQQEVLNYLKLDDSSLISISGYFTLNPEQL